jgi:hypothetical protein
VSGRLGRRCKGLFSASANPPLGLPGGRGGLGDSESPTVRHLIEDQVTGRSVEGHSDRSVLREPQSNLSCLVFAYRWRISVRPSGRLCIANHLRHDEGSTPDFLGRNRTFCARLMVLSAGPLVKTESALCGLARATSCRADLLHAMHVSFVSGGLARSTFCRSERYDGLGSSR